MIEKIIVVLSGFIIAVISATGYLGIVILMGIESACIPLPSEVIMPFSGYLVYTGRFKLFWVAFAGALGCNVGSALAYWVGYYGGRPLVEKYGSYILLSETELNWADKFFTRYGSITVFVSRLLPVIRTFIALPAGIAKMNQLRFHIYTFVGSFPWCWGLAYLGMKLGERWNTDPRVKEWFHRSDAVIIAIVLIGAIWFVHSRWKHRVRVAN